MTAGEYAAARAAHAADLAGVLGPHRERRRLGLKHPVIDFLFEYYSNSPGRLERYSPDLGAVVEVADPSDLDWPEFWTPAPGGVTLDAGRFAASRLESLRWQVEYLRRTQSREPFFGCFGLHEWAMVYKEAPRHRAVPLRLGAAGTDAVVEANSLKCSHFDAFRFFAPEAVARNRVALTRAGALDSDNPACLHVVMDLYRHAYKLAPFTGSEVTRAAFHLALRARELDMRASPYDLRDFGLTPVAVETRAGRDEYAAGQRQLYAESSPIRAELLRQLAILLDALTGHDGVSTTHT